MEQKNFPSEMVANSNRFSESKPLLRTRRDQIEEKGYDTNKKIFGFYVEGPDGAYAWWVAFAAFLITFITSGILRIYGILLPHLLTVFGINRTMASLPFSLQYAMRFLFGPLAGILAHKFGVRKITFIGVVISAVSTALCCWASHYIWIIFYWGIFTGLGISLCTNLLQLTIGQYFVKNKSSAIGMSLAGGCLGSIALPSIIELFLQMLEFRFVFLCMGGIFALAAPFSLAFKEPSWLNVQNRKSNNYENLNALKAIGSLENSLQKAQIKDFSKEGDSDTMETFFKHMPNITLLRKHKDLLTKLLRRATILELKLSKEDKLCLETSIQISLENLFQYLEEILGNFTENVSVSNECQNETLKPICASNFTNLALNKHNAISLIQIEESSNKTSTSSIIKKLEKIIHMTPSEIIAVSPHENKQDILIIIRELTYLCIFVADLQKQENSPSFPDSLVQDIHLQNEDRSTSNSKCHRLGFLLKSIWNYFKSFWKPVLVLYKNPLFLFISICRLTHFMTFMPVLVIIGDFLMDKELPQSDGQYGVISLSVGDFIGRMFTGWVTDKGYLSLPNFMAVILFSQCASVVTLPFIYNRNMILIAFSIFGLLQGSYYVRHPVLISNYMDKEEQHFAMGCLSFFSGVFACVLPLYVGFFKDRIGSYDIMFYTSGSIEAIVGFIWCLVSIFQVFPSVSETTTESDK